MDKKWVRNDSDPYFGRGTHYLHFKLLELHSKFISEAIHYLKMSNHCPKSRHECSNCPHPTKLGCVPSLAVNYGHLSLNSILTLTVESETHFIARYSSIFLVNPSCYNRPESNTKVRPGFDCLDISGWSGLQ